MEVDVRAPSKMTLDDMTGEEIAVAVEKLRATEGALNLTIGQYLGKNDRAASSFRLMLRQ